MNTEHSGGFSRLAFYHASTNGGKWGTSLLFYIIMSLHRPSDPKRENEYMLYFPARTQLG